MKSNPTASPDANAAPGPPSTSTERASRPRWLLSSRAGWIALVVALLSIGWTLFADWDPNKSAVQNFQADLGLGLAIALVGIIFAMFAEMVHRENYGMLHLEELRRQADEALARVEKSVGSNYEQHRDFLNEIVDSQREVGGLADKFLQLQGENPGILFREFANRLIADINKRFERMLADKIFELQVRSPVSDYESYWVERLTGGKSNFKTVSNCVIWSPMHLGFRYGNTSKYLYRQIERCMESKAREHTVQRLFIVPPASSRESHSQQYQEALSCLRLYQEQTKLIFEQLMAAQTEKTSKDASDAKPLDAAEFAARFQTRVYECSTLREYQGHFQNPVTGLAEEFNSENYAIWESGGNNEMIANIVVYQPADRHEEIPRLNGHPSPNWPDFEIRSVVFSSADKTAKLLEEDFRIRWNRSQRTSSIEDFLAQHPAATSGTSKAPFEALQPES